MNEDNKISKEFMDLVATNDYKNQYAQYVESMSRFDGELRGRRPTTPNRKTDKERKPENYYPTQVKLNRFATSLEEYSNRMKDREVHNHFEVQGFSIAAINHKNALKSIRRMLGQSGLGPDTTKEDFVMLAVQHGQGEE